MREGAADPSARRCPGDDGSPQSASSQAACPPRLHPLEFLMPVDINLSRHELPIRHVPNACPLAFGSRAHRRGHRTGRQRSRTVTAVVKRCPDGQCRVEVPPWLTSAPWWRSGRRVWISIRRGSLCISPVPSGPRAMKRWSCRVRRAPLTLTRRLPTSGMPCGQMLSERHARRCIGILDPIESTSTPEVAS